MLARPECNWVGAELEQSAQRYAVAQVVPEHVAEVRGARQPLIDKTRDAVQKRLSLEIAHWDNRAEQLKLQEQAGKVNARLNSAQARRRADRLEERLAKRLADLEQERQISPRPPVVLGAALIVPLGLLRTMQGGPETRPIAAAADTQAAAARARAIVMAVERGLGYQPTDREFEKRGYDIESRDPAGGRLRFIEVKGRVSGAASITVTRNEVLYSLNQPESYILAIVEFLENGDHYVHYLRRPFQREPDFGVTSVNYSFAKLLARAEAPA